MPGALNQGRKRAMSSTMTAPPMARSLPVQPRPAVAGAGGGGGGGGAFGYGDVSLVMVASASAECAADPRTKTGSRVRLLQLTPEVVQQTPESVQQTREGCHRWWRRQPSLLASGPSTSARYPGSR